MVGSRRIGRAAAAGLLPMLLAAGASGAASRAVSGPILIRTADRSGTTHLVVVDGGQRRTVPTVGTNPDEASGSRDGAQLAYVTELKDRSAVLYSQRVDGSERRRLVLAPATCPSNTCAGIRFAWGPGDQLAVAFADALGWHLEVLAADGALVRELSPRPGPDVSYWNISWSPDGRWLGFTRYAGVEGSTTCCVNEYDVVRPDGSGLRTVFSAAEPIHDTPVIRWAPDGTRLAFATDARAAGDPALAILDIPSGTAHRLRRYPGGGSVPSWSPDGRRIAFAALVPLRGGFFMRRVVIAAPDGTPQGTLAAPGAPVDVTWSPDGARLLVTVAPSPDAQAREVHIVHPTGGTASAVIRLPHGSGVLDAEWASRG